MITREGAKPFPPTGYRTTGRAPMVLLRRHRHHAGDGHARDRHRLAVPLRHRWMPTRTTSTARKTYKVTLPKGIPAVELLVVDALRQPDALDARHAAALSARRQPELSVARRRGERRRLDDGVLQPRRSPTACKRGNWIQTDPTKGWFVDPAPLQPARTVLHKAWRPSEIELVSQAGKPRLAIRSNFLWLRGPLWVKNGCQPQRNPGRF